MLLSLELLLLTTALEASGERVDESSCPSTWMDATSVGLGCLYFEARETLSWEAASEFCQGEQGGQLVEVHGEEQFDFLLMVLAMLGDHEGGQYWWLGGTDVGREGRWFWISTLTPVQGSIWQSSYPQHDTARNCLDFHTKNFGVSSHNPCSTPLKPVCQRTAETPTTTTLTTAKETTTGTKTTTTEQETTTVGPDPCDELCQTQEEGYYAEVCCSSHYCECDGSGSGMSHHCYEYWGSQGFCASTQQCQDLTECQADGSCCSAQPTTTPEPPADCNSLCDGTSDMATTGCCAPGYCYCLGAGAGLYVDCAGHQVCGVCGPGEACDPCSSSTCDEEECCEQG